MNSLLDKYSKSLGKKSAFGFASEVKDSDGVVVARQIDQKERWASHLKKSFKEEAEELQISIQPILHDEIKLAIGKIRILR